MPDFYGGRLECPCGSTEFMRANAEDDTCDEEVPESVIFQDSDDALCMACGDALENEDFPWLKKFVNFCVGEVREVEAVKKLLKLTVRIRSSPSEEEVGVVTNDTKVFN